jgi:hypothetical protein
VGADCCFCKKDKKTPTPQATNAHITNEATTGLIGLNGQFISLKSAARFF